MAAQQPEFTIAELIEGVQNTYSEAQAAGHLGISVSSLRKSRMNGQRDGHLPMIPFVRLGRRVVYLRNDLDDVLAANRVVGV